VSSATSSAGGDDGLTVDASDGSAAIGIGEGGGGIDDNAVELGVGAGWTSCEIGVLSSAEPSRIAAVKQLSTSAAAELSK
jgi:hypothetical protein